MSQNVLGQIEIVKACMPQAEVPWLRGEPDPALGSGTFIGPFSRVNIFVGPNNSGKSRVLRELAGQSRSTHFLVTGGFQDQARTALAQTQPHVRAMIASMRMGNPAEQQALDIVRRLLEQHPACELATFVADSRNGVAWLDVAMDVLSNHVHGSGHLLNLLAQHRKEMPHDRNARTQEIQNGFSRLYVPLLRSLRPIKLDQAGGGLHARTAKDYSGQLVSSAHILSGEDIYHRFQRLRLGSPQDRQLLDDYENFLSKWFFDGRQIYLTPKMDGDNDVLHIGFTGQSEELPIYKLGDGIAQLIMNTFPLFMPSPHPVLLFVEEPETSLHPGLQRRLVESWLDDSFPRMPKHQVFLTTHSTAFLDITLDQSAISVFQVQRDGEVPLEKHGQPIRVRFASGGARHLLAELGMASSMIFLSNCSVWVEGPTERYYLRHFLKLLSQAEDILPLTENLHYSFLPYGGSNITHWSFLEEGGIDADRISSNMILIADDDNVEEGTEKYERLKMLEKKLKDFVKLDVREIENLLTPQNLQAIVSKREKRPVVLDFSSADLRRGKVGATLQEAVERACAGPHLKYCDKGGKNVWNKVDMAQLACETITSFAELPPDAQALIRRIDTFIRDHNKGLKPKPKKG